MQFWILSPSVHVLDIRELGFRHISDCLLSRAHLASVRLDGFALQASMSFIL